MNSEFKNEILMDGFLVSKDLENKKFQIKNNDDIIEFRYDENSDYITNKFSYYRPTKKMFVNTLEGKMEVAKGDYIIKGIKGEVYPCKPDIFINTYDEVTE